MSKIETPKQQKRLSPELSEFLHMLKALEKQEPAPQTQDIR
jgi:hypothetical protein